MAGTVAREMRLARAAATRTLGFFREPRPEAELPEPLRGFKPAQIWSDSTLRLWDALAGLDNRQAREAIVSLDIFASLVVDLVVMAGPTPWNDPHQGYVVFAGARVSPDPADVRLALVVEPMRFTDDGNPWEVP